eukprot:125705_1
MGKLLKIYLTGSVYSCAICHSHLAVHEEVISTQFRGRTGRAYLFGHVVNVEFGPLEERTLTTGGHIVCDVYCICCHSNVGWKYEHAFEESQKYKEGKFCVEKALMKKE